MEFAVLMTCHNRARTTVACLESLYACSLPDNVTFRVYLVDDGSSDGTGEIVRERFPDVRLVGGTGSLYWCGGMRLAWNTAVGEHTFDAFLWLNDDTRLMPDALKVLIDTARETTARAGIEGLIVGATCDPVSQRTTYGVAAAESRAPAGVPTEFGTNETMNGNVVWVPRSSWQALGNLGEWYTHAMGDTDYGLRAREKGIPLWLTPSHVGYCTANKVSTWTDPRVPLLDRLRNLHSPKGCPPMQYVHIARLMHPWAWPLYIANLYRRALFVEQPKS